MAETKVKKYKVLAAILYKGKHYQAGTTVDSSVMDQKTIDRLADKNCLEEVKSSSGSSKKK